MRDSKNNIVVEECLAAASISADVDSTGVDIRDYDSVTFAVSSVTTAAGTYLIEESDSLGSGYAAAAAADVVGGTNSATLANGTAVELGYIGQKRYVRAAITISSGTGIVGAVAVKSNPKIAKVTE